MSYTPTTAWGPVSALCESARSGGQSYKTLLKSLDVVLDNELWREFVMPPARVHTFARFDEFLKFAGFPPDELLAVLRAHGRDELAARVRSELGGELAEQGKWERDEPSKVRDTKLSRQDDATYLVSRLKRDEPELAEQVLTGKISANAAAVQAGIRHAYIRVRADDVQLAVVKLLERYDRDDVLGALGVRP
jgi:hypothetical protein